MEIEYLEGSIVGLFNIGKQEFVLCCIVWIYSLFVRDS